MIIWEERVSRAEERYADGLARLPDDPDERQRQLTRMGNAAWAAGLSLLMLDRRDEAVPWLERAAERYRESWPDAPPESWGRPIAALKARLLVGDAEGARAEARWALDAGAEASDSPIGRYAATLARLVLDEDSEAAALVSALEERSEFPQPVSRALTALAEADERRYDDAVRALLADFEGRDAFLEDVPVADTVAVLQVLAAARGLLVPLESAMLPG